MKLCSVALCSVCCALLCGDVFAGPKKSKSDGELYTKETQQSPIKRSKSRNDVVQELALQWFAAAKSGNLEKMKKLWNDGLNYNIYVKDDSGKTALEIAITEGHTEMVKWIVKRTDEQEEKDQASNFNLRSSNKDGESMMIIAAKKGHVDILKFMLQRGMDPDNDTYRDHSSGNYGKTPLIVGTENGHVEVVDLLLTNKGDPDLLKRDHSRADPNNQDYTGRTALMYAAEEGHEDIVTLLLNNKAKLNIKDKRGDTALICAVRQDNYNIAKILLEKGAKINEKNKKGKTALDFAEENEEMTNLLMDYINRPENQKKRSLKQKALSIFTKKRKKSSANSDAIHLEDDTEAGRDIDDVLSSADDETSDEE